jgi:hypothetical protein
MGTLMGTRKDTGAAADLTPCYFILFYFWQQGRCTMTIVPSIEKENYMGIAALGCQRPTNTSSV